MSRLMTKLFFSRLLAAVLLADYGTLVVLNGVRAPVESTAGVFFCCLLLAFLLTAGLKPRRFSFRADGWSALMLLLALVLLTVPRLPYLADWIPGNEVLSHSDDSARLLELLAMTASPGYPLRSPSNAAYLFSYYYCGLYPMAVLKLLAPFLTIKECVALGNLFYHLLLLLSLAEIAFLLLRDPLKARTLLFFCTLFGGLDWLASGSPWYAPGHFEWWQTRLHGNAQISSFYTAMFWTVQHFLAAWAAVLAYALVFRTRQAAPRWVKGVLAAGLLMTAAHTSPFAAVTCPLFLLVHRRVVWRKGFRLPVLALLPTFLVPLSVYSHRVVGLQLLPAGFRLVLTGRFWLDKLLSLPLFVLLVPSVELAALPLLLPILRPRWGRRPRQYLLISLLFLLATFLVASRGRNNLCMRGMLLPQFVFFTLAAERAPAAYRGLVRRLGRAAAVGLVCAAVVLFSAGTVKECAGRLRVAAQLTRLSYTWRHRPAPQPLQYPVYEIASDRRIRFIAFSAARAVGRRHIYDFEKFIRGLILSEMTEWERELIRRPDGE